MNARVTSYDAFRGILLVGMVFFHVLTNLTRLTFEQHLFYWIPQGFIFFLGLVLGQFLFQRFQKKLILGAKLGFLFLAFNAPVFWKGSFESQDLILGNPNVFSFEILLPMAVLIFLTLFLDFTWRFGKILFLVLAGLLLWFSFLNVESYNILFLVYGLLGYYLAFSVDLDALVRRIQSPLALIFSGLFAGGVFLSIQHGFFFPWLSLVQVLALYIVCFPLQHQKSLIMLGRYSLVLYVGHILLIRLILEL